jgi:hypothetical protein
MKRKYIDRTFGEKRMAVIDHANKIIEELCANTMREYQNLASVINDARLAGLVSWTAIIDRTRNLESMPHWEDPKQFMESVMPQFAIDKWLEQPNRVEVWIEKDALVGVIERICRKHDVAYFSCRGYTSQSEMWSASQRLIEYRDAGQTPIIIHLGDHDPSGKDMTRDIDDRLAMFMEEGIEINRIALNMEQVRKYRPPPNPAKITDSRAKGYIAEFGSKSWELDALDPKVLMALVQDTILEYRDERIWKAAVKLEAEGRERLVELTEQIEGEDDDDTE